MKEHGSTLSVWVSEMPRALYVLSSILRCQIPLHGLQLQDRGQRGIQMTARLEMTDAERIRIERQLESIVGVVQARIIPDEPMQPVTATSMDWMSIAAMSARFR